MLPFLFVVKEKSRLADVLTEGMLVLHLIKSLTW